MLRCRFLLKYSYRSSIYFYSTSSNNNNNKLNLDLSNFELFNKSSSKNHENESNFNPEPIKPLKLEKTIDKLWEKNESTSKKIKKKIEIPEKYNKIFYNDNDSIIESDDDNITFNDPYSSFERYNNLDDDISSDSIEEIAQPTVKQTSKKVSIEQDTNKIMASMLQGISKNNAEVDSEDLDSFLDGAVKKTEKKRRIDTNEERPITSTVRRDQKSDSQITLDNNDMLQNIKEDKSFKEGEGESGVDSYTIEDLLDKEHFTTTKVENINLDVTLQSGYIEDIDLDSYTFSENDPSEAKQFLQDVAKFKMTDFSIEKRKKVQEMILKARKVIDSYKESESFWDDLVVFRQLQKFCDLSPIHFRPVLNPQVKESLYLLYQSDPDQWTTAKLAQRFRIKKARVEAILLLKIDEHMLRRNAPWEVNPNGDKIDELYAEYFGMTPNGDWLGFEDDRFSLNEKRWRNASVNMIDDEQEDLATLARLAVRVRPQWFEMPEYRPTGPDAFPRVYPDGEPIRGPLHKYYSPASRVSEYICVDLSPIENFEEQCKMFWIKRNGELRHTTWEERRRVFRKNQFCLASSKQLFVTQTVLTDPVIFPTDKEEEKLIEEQKNPLLKNRRFATQKIFKENDILRELDKDYSRFGKLLLPASNYVHGRMPWSVQEMLKKQRATNILDTIYKPLHDHFQ